MNASRTILLAAIVANVGGWLLPAFYNESGWKAFVLALSPLWDYQSFRDESPWLLALVVASALTNVLFFVLAAVLVLRVERAKAVLWGAAAATLLNLHWPISMGDQRRLLEGGYFIWVCSFALLALSSFLAVRPLRR
jgi:hypothetical protein